MQQVVRHSSKLVRPCAFAHPTMGSAPRCTAVRLQNVHTATSAQFQRSTLSRSRLTRSPVVVRSLFNFGSTAQKSGDFYSYEVKDIDGKSVKLDKYKGQVVLVVNLASQCGFTPQYTELQELYDKYNKKGFTVLGFPCNQFGGQEPGPNSQIKKFAQSTYGAKFPLFAKVDVNGGSADPLFDWLKQQKGGILNNDIKWNFSKFLVDRTGKVVGRFASTTTPGAIAAEIEKLL